ncbi:hypothetical protein ACI7YT_12615 [Microbacterium sp. M]|uniref:hypothetical protein n=1 Tax=Microbacterium sp. M TaxID=3377125 RepID=UPI00386F075A
MTIRTTRRFPKAGRKRGLAPAIAIMSTVPLGIAGAIGVGIARVNTVETHTSCTVSEKEDRALASLDKREPRVYTDCGVFVVADEPFRFHFGAADVYNELQAGETVDLTTVGWRFGLFSWFPNVVDVEVAS